MHRRGFLGAIAGGLVHAAGARRTMAQAARISSKDQPVIHTVRGPVPARDLGRVLPHEHVLVDFVGADAFSAARYDADAVVESVLPHLRRARDLGVAGLFECTPNYLGRDPRLLARLSAVSGLHLVTNTGLYGARQNKFLPAYARTESAAQLAGRWIAEARAGIGDTGVRPGFIKSGIDPEPQLSPQHRTLIAAAALTHAATGLAVAVHTGRGPGLAVLDVLREHGVAAAAFLWVHAQSAADDALFAAADRGAWLSLDGLNAASLSRHLHLCRELRKRGHVERMLLSHDAGWYDPGKPGGGEFRPFDLLFTTFLPQLRENGFSADDIDQIVIRNPAAAFAVQTR